MASEFDDARMYLAGNLSGFDEEEDSFYTRKCKLREFIRNFRDNNCYTYREQLLRHYRKGEFRLDVNIGHLGLYDENLLHALRTSPNQTLKQFELAAREALAISTQVGSNQDMESLPEIQVTVYSDETPLPIRSITSADINKLLVIPGIVISASRARPKATSVSIQCQKCHTTKRILLETAFGAAQVPKRCWDDECRNKKEKENLIPLPDEAKYVDQQSLKLQEAPEVVPTGEMPRSILLVADRYLVDQVSPGTRVSVFGISSVVSTSADKTGAGSSVKTPYLRVVGIHVLSEGSGRTSPRFTDKEEEMCLEISRSPDVYEKIVRSIAPAISGSYTVDIKKAIACLLFGGSRKRLPDGLKLRGDINVLLLGDPSTAKSQFLKFVERVAPVGVYTSGKGSSAAGLTASVIRDARGEFFLEGGAMVLADGGVVCIDEFDKMREQDRVAIHEAMEQQTISVAKAGITTILNSRASVLAAANPAFGTYNDAKSAAENIDFLPTILSRFDMIFIVRDVRDQEKDRLIAKHVLGIHVGFGGSVKASTSQDVIQDEGELDLVTMKKYISYCRAKCSPCLSAEAAEMLRNHYVGIREEHRRRRDERGNGASTVPITVRQLEAIIRISESLAKMCLMPEATPEHVTEAIRLFKVSTLNAAQNGSGISDVALLSPDQAKEVQRVEEQIQRYISIGSIVPTKKLLDDFVVKQGFTSVAVNRALQIMVSRAELAHLNQQKTIKRLR